MKRIIHTVLIAVFSVFLLFSLLSIDKTPDSAGDYLLAKGRDETGAINLVTAIYLGYRAFDTLGETIVLITSVSAVVFLMGGKA